MGRPKKQVVDRNIGATPGLTSDVALEMVDKAIEEMPYLHTGEFPPEIEDILGGLTSQQARWALIRSGCDTDAEASRVAKIDPVIARIWSPEVKERTKKLAHWVAAETFNTALVLRKRMLIEAMVVKLDGLRSDDEGIRQRVATEIIEWELGKAAQQVNVNKKVVSVAVTPQDLGMSPDKMAEVIRVLNSAGQLEVSAGVSGEPQPNDVIDAEVDEVYTDNPDG